MSLRWILSVFIGFVLSITTALAGEGWYVGAGGYYTDVEARMHYHQSGLEFFDFKESRSTGGGQVNGGYQWLFPMSYSVASLAIELAGEFQKTKFEHSARPTSPVFKSPVSAEMTFDSSVVLTAKPGIFITNNILAYGEVGGVYTLISDIKTDAGTRSSTMTYYQFGDYGTESLFGFRVGAGLNFLLTKKFSIEAAWRYTTYSDFNKSRVIFPTNVPPTEEFLDISDLTTQQAFLGFHYYFWD